jgi:hypothetical protein
MAISIDWATQIITVPQSYLTHISGALYELDVDQLRLDLKDIEDSEEGMAFPDTHRHNTAVTLSGVTYARTVEIINGYTVTFENGNYSVRCVGANHNIGDVKNVNSVSLIIGNAAGLISVSSGSGLDASQDAKLTAINAQLAEIEAGYGHAQLMRLFAAALAGIVSGAAGTNVKFRDLGDTKDRIDATVDQYGNRSAVVLDAD